MSEVGEAAPLRATQIIAAIQSDEVLRGMVLVEMIVNEHLEWQDERRLLVEMVTRYLQDG